MVLESLADWSIGSLIHVAVCRERRRRVHLIFLDRNQQTGGSSIDETRLFEHGIGLPA